MTVDLSALYVLLNQINPVYGALFAAVLYFLGPKLVPLLQKLLAKVPGGVPVAPVVPVTPADPTKPDAPKATPVLDVLQKLLLDYLNRRAAREGKAPEHLLAEWVADEAKDTPVVK